MMVAEPEAAGRWRQGHEVALTRLLIGTKGLFVRKSQERLSGTGMVEIRFDCMQLSSTCSHDDMSERLQSPAAGIRERFVWCA